jgi:nuclear pore complex protein Nup155
MLTTLGPAQSADGWFTRRCRKLNQTTTMLSAFVPAFLPALVASALGGAPDAVVQLVVDPARSFLYALTARSVVHAFWLGGAAAAAPAAWTGPGGPFVRLGSLTTLVDDVRRRAPTLAQGDAAQWRVAALHPVAAEESALVHLLAVTNQGPPAFSQTHTEAQMESEREREKERHIHRHT